MTQANTDINSPKEIDQDTVWPVGKKNAIFTCIIIFLLGFMDFVDRQIMTALFPFIKAEWALTDTQLGSLMSIVNLSIAILVTPCAYFIDKWSRKGMITLMGSVWSIATGLCAFTTGFGSLLATRFVVGFGEAGYNPAAQALLAATFPKRHRTTAVAFAQFGMMLGTPAGLIIGAYIGTHWGWRHAFGVVAIPGIIIAGLALFIKDYKTIKPTPAQIAENAKKPKVNFFNNFYQLCKIPSLMCACGGAAFYLLGTTGAGAFMPLYFIRYGGCDIQTASNLAAVSGIFTIFSVVILAPFVDLLRKRWDNATPLSLAATTFIGTGFYLAGMLFIAPASALQIAFFCVASFFISAITIIGITMATDVVAPANRASAVSLLVFAQNIFGMALGPILAGFLSDKFELPTAIVMLLVFPMLAGVLYVISAFTYKKDISKVSSEKVVFA